jgi:hypothetical protein
MAPLGGGLATATRADARPEAGNVARLGEWLAGLRKRLIAYKNANLCNACWRAT